MRQRPALGASLLRYYFWEATFVRYKDLGLVMLSVPAGPGKGQLDLASEDDGAPPGVAASPLQGWWNLYQRSNG